MFKRLLAVPVGGINTIVVEGATGYVEQLLPRLSGNVINLGVPCDGSFLVRDFIAKVKRVNLRDFSVFCEQQDNQVHGHVVVNVTDGTDFNQLEELNEHLQTASELGFRFHIIIEKSELSRSTPSFYSRVMPHIRPGSKAGSDEPRMDDNQHSEDHQVSISLPVDIPTLLHTAQFEVNTQELEFKSRFGDLLHNVVKKNKNLKTLVFQVKKITPELEAIIQCLNATQRLDQYGVTRLISGKRSTQRIHFKLEVLGSSSPSSLIQEVCNQVQMVEGGRLRLDNLIEISNFNADVMLSDRKILTYNPHRGEYFQNKVPPIKHVYVARPLSKENGVLLANWCAQDPSRRIFIYTGKVFLWADLQVESEMASPVSSEKDIQRISQSQLCRNIMSHHDRRVRLYSSYCQPDTIVNGIPLAVDSNFFVDHVSDFDLLRHNITTHPKNVFYVSESVYKKLIEFGEFINPENIFILESNEELNVSLRNHLKGLEGNEKLETFMTQTVTVRMSILLARGLTETQAFKAAIINGLPPHMLTPEIKRYFATVECPKDLPTYTYSNLGLNAFFEYESGATYDILEGLNHPRNEGKITIRCLNEVNDSEVAGAISAGGLFLCPRWSRGVTQEDSPESGRNDELLNGEEQLSRFSESNFIGSQQEKMVEDLCDDLNQLHAASEGKLPYLCRLLYGAPGTGKDMIANLLVDENPDCVTMACSEVLNLRRVDHYLRQMDHLSEVKTSKIVVFNFQEVNLTSEHLNALQRLILHAYSHYPASKIYIIATANNYSSRSPLTKDQRELIQVTPVSGLSDIDIDNALESFFAGDQFNQQRDYFRRAVDECLHKSRINFRLINQMANDIKKDDFGDNNWRDYIREVLHVELEVDETGANDEVSRFLDSGPWLMKTILKSFFGILNIYFFSQIFPFLISFLSPDRTETVLPIMPNNQSKYPEHTFHSQDSLLEAPDLSGVDFDCQEMIEQWMLVLGVVYGSIQVVPTPQFLGVSQNIQYFKQALTSPLLQLNGAHVFGVGGRLLDNIVVVNPPFSSADAARFLSVLKEKMGGFVFEVLMNRMSMVNDAMEGLDVVQEFYNRYFTYDTRMLNYPPELMTNSDLSWMAKMLEVGSGVCSHFARFAYMMLRSFGYESDVAQLLPCDSTEYHEAVLLQLPNGEYVIRDIQGPVVNKTTEDSVDTNYLKDLMNSAYENGIPQSVSMFAYLILKHAPLTVLGFISFVSTIIAFKPSKLPSIRLDKPGERTFALKTNATVTKPLDPGSKWPKDWISWTEQSSQRKKVIYSKDNPLSFDKLTDAGLDVRDLYLELEIRGYQVEGNQEFLDDDLKSRLRKVYQMDVSSENPKFISKVPAEWSERRYLEQGLKHHRINLRAMGDLFTALNHLFNKSQGTVAAESGLYNAIRAVESIDGEAIDKLCVLLNNPNFKRNLKGITEFTILAKLASNTFFEAFISAYTDGKFEGEERLLQSTPAGATALMVCTSIEKFHILWKAVPAATKEFFARKKERSGTSALTILCNYVTGNEALRLFLIKELLKYGASVNLNQQNQNDRTPLGLLELNYKGVTGTPVKARKGTEESSILLREHGAQLSRLEDSIKKWVENKDTFDFRAQAMILVFFFAFLLDLFFPVVNAYLSSIDQNEEFHTRN
jgi:hypothetical protein